MRCAFAAVFGAQPFVRYRSSSPSFSASKKSAPQDQPFSPGSMVRSSTASKGRSGPALRSSLLPLTYSVVAMIRSLNLMVSEGAGNLKPTFFENMSMVDT